MSSQTKLTHTETDKIGPVSYLHNPSLEKIESLDLLYGQYNKLTLWISARSERIICLVTNRLTLLSILKIKIVYLVENICLKAFLYLSLFLFTFELQQCGVLFNL